MSNINTNYAIDAPTIGPREAFAVQIGTIIQTSHSHNVTACRKRLLNAQNLFLACCRFNSSHDLMVRTFIEQIILTVEDLRLIDGADDAGVAQIKTNALTIAAKLRQGSEFLELTDNQAEIPELRSANDEAAVVPAPIAATA